MLTCKSVPACNLHRKCCCLISCARVTYQIDDSCVLSTLFILHFNDYFHPFVQPYDICLNAPNDLFYIFSVYINVRWRWFHSRFTFYSSVLTFLVFSIVLSPPLQAIDLEVLKTIEWYKNFLLGVFWRH